MQFFIYLKENATLNQFKSEIINNIHNIQNLIEDYLNDDLDDLNKITTQLDIIRQKLSALGYTYSPEVMPDISEEEFRNILDKFRDELSNLYNSLFKEGIESFNTQIGYLYNLIEIHKAGGLNED